MTEKGPKRDRNREEIVAIIERADRRASNPETPKFLGRLAALNASIHRTLLELNDSLDARFSRWDEKLKANEKRLDERIVEGLDKLLGTKKADHRAVSSSGEVSRFDTAGHVGVINIDTLMNEPSRSVDQKATPDAESADQDQVPKISTPE